MHYNNDSDSFHNINAAFHDEAADHVRYKILSEHAAADGNADLAKLYDELAVEEYSHAKLWHGHLGAYDAERELDGRIKAEKNDRYYVYPQYAAAAEKDGYEELADRFLANGCAEGGHADALEAYRTQTQNGTRHHSHEDVEWHCSVCGHRHMGTDAPDECPLCGYGRTAYRRVQ